jgi:hypothetical protein
MASVLDRVFRRVSTAHALSTTLPTVSPYSPAAQLPPLLLSDLYSDAELAKLPMTREDAMSVPAVARARNLLISTIAKFPLRALRHDEATRSDVDITTEHPWLYRTNSAVSPYERLAWTVDDLIFYGCSVWLLDRGAPVDGRRPILNAEWLPASRWEIVTVDGEHRLEVDGMPIADDRFILINSPFEGLLNIGQETLRGGRYIEKAWVGRIRNPIPLIDLHFTDDEERTEQEIKTLVDTWSAARTRDNGAVGSTPHNVQLNVLGEVKHELFVEGRNAIRTDIGSFLNVRVAMIDGTIGVDSLTYTTKDGEKNSFYEFDLPFWTDPITARLSLDDVVPRGTRIRFDMYDAHNLPAPTGPTVED